MKKQVIRLTESDLHQMIQEAVKQTLNELDWKTYANAGKKAGAMGSISAQREANPNLTPNQMLGKAVDARNRADKFYAKSKNQFNKDFGYSNGNMYDDGHADAGMGGSFTSSEEFGPHAVGHKDKGYGTPYKYEYGRRYDGYHGESMSPEEFYGDNTEAADAFNKSDAEIKNYQKGNYQYNKGKGWGLKK